MAARLVAPEIGAKEFDRLAQKAPTKELRTAMVAASAWVVLGQKYLDNRKSLREAYSKWARRKK